jgi:hypothetical protein
MGLLTKKPSRGDAPCADAFLALLNTQRAVQSEDAEWAAKETKQAAELRSLEAAQALLTQLEDRHTAALADIAVHGSSADDPTALASDIECQRAHVEKLVARGKVADAALVRIRRERQRLRTQSQALSTGYLQARHAALTERMVTLAEEFKRAEAAYLATFVRAFGAAAAADRVARERPQLGFAMGGLNLADMLLPRPINAAFQPRPERSQISAEIEAEADHISKEFT